MRHLLFFSLLLLAGCVNQAVNPPQTSNAITSRETTTAQSDTILLKAQGNEPFWSVTFTKTEMELSGLDIETLTVPLPKEITRPVDANVYAYRAQTEQGDLFVELTPENCDDTMADRSYPFSARVQVKRAGAADYTTYVGCADYPENYQPLVGDWRVVSIDGNTIEEGPQQPTITFAGVKGTVSGSTGCNRFNGTYILEENSSRLTFSPLAVTRKMCRGENPEQAFLSVLRAQPLGVVMLPGWVFLRNSTGRRMELGR